MTAVQTQVTGRTSTERLLLGLERFLALGANGGAYFINAWVMLVLAFRIPIGPRP